eukprot:scaffold1311_cov256-Pinguiococcus_pyrenoidosus.AAC.58
MSDILVPEEIERFTRRALSLITHRAAEHGLDIGKTPCRCGRLTNAHRSVLCAPRPAPQNHARRHQLKEASRS